MNRISGMGHSSREIYSKRNERLLSGLDSRRQGSVEPPWRLAPAVCYVVWRGEARFHKIAENRSLVDPTLAAFTRAFIVCGLLQVLAVCVTHFWKSSRLEKKRKHRTSYPVFIWCDCVGRIRCRHFISKKFLCTPYYDFSLLRTPPHLYPASPDPARCSKIVAKAQDSQWILGKFWFVQRCCPVEEHGVSLVNIVEISYHFRRNILVI